MEKIILVFCFFIASFFLGCKSTELDLTRLDKPIILGGKACIGEPKFAIQRTNIPYSANITHQSTTISQSYGYGAYSYTQTTTETTRINNASSIAWNLLASAPDRSIGNIEINIEGYYLNGLMVLSDLSQINVSGNVYQSISGDVARVLGEER